LWQFGDGGQVAGTLTPTHTYGDDGNYAVTLRVTDTTGLVGTVSLVAAVSNVTPSVSITTSALVVEQGQPVTFTGVFTDPGWIDEHAFEWDFGDGTTEIGWVLSGGTLGGGVMTSTHVYPAAGQYPVTLTVSDDDGGVGHASIYVQVSEAPGAPQVTAGPDLSADEGSPLNFTAIITDSDTPTGHAILWQFGDGGQVAGTLTPTHTYGDDGNYAVTLRVTDTTGLVGTVSLVAA
ncbi:MAG: PKD domain-containing protein, partial [Aestuariibacter sp.]|nr:PKD domain-containing protein [Aestuariibacter sp.]